MLSNQPDKSVRLLCWRRPIFPGGFPPSIFGTIELNYRVRNGNGWTLNVINTNYYAPWHIIYIQASKKQEVKYGDP